MKTELVFKSEKGTPITDSLLVAEKFGKEHRHVLDSIRNLVAENSAAKLFFIESQYENRGKLYPMYIMSRDGFSLLVMGFTGSKALAFKIEFIEAFNKIEQQIKTLQIPTTFAEALRLAAEQAEDIERKNKQIEEQKPKVVFAESVMGSSNLILIRDFAKSLCDDDFKIGQNRLYAWFRENGILNSRNEPYQNYVERGYFEVITRVIGSGEATFTTNTTKITGAGQVYFAKRIRDTYKQEQPA